MESKPTLKALHQGYVCDGCEGEIRGARYKCTVCQDFDYCEKCEDSIAHEHSFIKIKSPEQKPAAIVTIIPEDGEARSSLQQFLGSNLLNVQEIFRDMVAEIPQHKETQPASTNTEAELIASVVGGAPEDYVNLVKDCAGLELDEMIEAALALKEN